MTVEDWGRHFPSVCLAANDTLRVSLMMLSVKKRKLMQCPKATKQKTRVPKEFLNDLRWDPSVYQRGVVSLSEPSAANKGFRKSVLDLTWLALD